MAEASKIPGLATAHHPTPAPLIAPTPRLLAQPARRFFSHGLNQQPCPSIDTNSPATISRQPALQTRSFSTPAPKRLRVTLPSTTPSTDSPLVRQDPREDNIGDKPRGRKRCRSPSVIEIPDCDENPAFFPGHKNVVAAWQNQQNGFTQPPVHSGQVRVCQNRTNHPNTPYHVCLTCHSQAWRHLELVEPSLLEWRFLPLCGTCAQRYLEKNFERDGRQRYVLGCSCLSESHEEAKFLCYDCLESNLMNAKARWAGEVEFRTGFAPDENIPIVGTGMQGCRCSASASELEKEVVEEKSFKWFICPGCEGLVNGDVKDLLEAPKQQFEGEEAETGQHYSGFGPRSIGHRRIETATMDAEAQRLVYQERDARIGNARVENSAIREAKNPPVGERRNLQTLRAPSGEDAERNRRRAEEPPISNANSDPEYEPEVVEEDGSISLDSATPS